MERWKEEVDPYQNEADLQRTCEDYLKILVSQNLVRYFIRKDRKDNVLDTGCCPDIIVWAKEPLFTGEELRVLTFELKAPKGGGTLTKKQKDFQNWLGLSASDHYITNDFGVFKKAIDETLNLED